MRRPRRAAWAVAAIYAAVLIWLVIFADAWSLNRLTVWMYVQMLGIAPQNTSPEHYGALLNVLLFVPLGWLLVRLTPLSWWLAAATCGLVSSTVELAQYLFLDRQSSWGDVVANLLGGLVGAVVAALGQTYAER